MMAKNIQPIAPSKLHTRIHSVANDWLWEGYLKPKGISLLVSEWKAGKTTLLSGILQKLGTGEPFLDRKVRPAKVLVFTEESEELWHERQLRQPLGDHIRLIFRPYHGNPTLDDWYEVLQIAREMRAAIGLDLLVIDTLAAHLPPYTENDIGSMYSAMRPTRDFADEGTAVLFLHHPRRAKSSEGNTSRGSGSLLGFVDFIIELKRFGPMRAQSNMRILSARSRNAIPQTQQVYAWDMADGEFHTVSDVGTNEFEYVWTEIEGILSDHPLGLGVNELLSLLDRSERPIHKDSLYKWLRRALNTQRVVRTGRGTRSEPYIYQLPELKDEVGRMKDEG